MLSFVCTVSFASGEVLPLPWIAKISATTTGGGGGIAP
jgi:hypothetical protein